MHKAVTDKVQERKATNIKVCEHCWKNGKMHNRYCFAGFPNEKICCQVCKKKCSKRCGKSKGILKKRLKK